MRIINVFAVIKNYTHAFLAYNKAKREVKKNQSFHADNKAVLIDMSQSHIYCRFFYLLIKFFSIEGYSIYFPNYNFSYYRKHFHEKGQRNYYKLLFEDQMMIFTTPPQNANIVLTLRDEHFSPDYFSPLFFNKNSEKAYFIPMTLHPNFYKLGIWNAPLDLTIKKKKSIFMVGNFDKAQYSRIKQTPFNIESRVEAYDYLKDKPFFTTVSSTEELEQFVNGPLDQCLILIDSRNVRIPTEQLRETLNNFTFFLALPGLVKPLSHNLIEAMSTGAIPILHKTYATVLVPNLEHMKNAIIYEDLKDLEDKIETAFNLEDHRIEKMRCEIEAYYQSNCTPKKVVENITSGSYEHFYLQTIQIGVKLFKNNHQAL